MNTDEAGQSIEFKSNEGNGIVFRIINLMGVMAIAGTLLGVVAAQHWIADVAVQFRVQYLIMLVPSVFLWVGKRFSTRSIIGGLALAINLWFVVPYFNPQNRATSATLQVADSIQPTLRLLMLNVLRTNSEIQKTLNEVVDQDADFVFLMEVAPSWASHLDELKDRYRPPAQ